MPDAKQEKLLGATLRAFRQLGEDASFPEVLNTFAAGLLPFIGGDRCVCAVLDADGHIAEAVGYTVEGELLKKPADALSHYLLQQVVRAREPVVVDDARRDRRWRSTADARHRRHVRSLLGLPVFRGERLAAVLCFSHGTAPLAPQAFDRLPFTLVQVLGLALPRETAGDEGTETSSSVDEEVASRDDAIRADTPSAALLEWHDFLTRSPLLKELFVTAERVASVDVPVLLVGEDGTGKDRLARAIHTASGCEGVFVVVSCRAIPPSLFEAELFGYEKGAFTGAEKARRGLVGEAEGGTLYLDDLADIPAGMQAALLRVLAEGVVRPLGGNEVREARFRLMAAATMPPEELVRQRLLREDLLFRIKGVTLTLPPLRKRPEDILFLFEHFLAEAGAGDELRLSADAERLVLLHPWSGNERELRNEARRLRALVQGEIAREDLSFFVPGAQPGDGEGATFRPLAEAVKQAEAEQIKRALALTRGNKSAAARLLGVTRRSLYRRLDLYGIE